MEACPGTGGSLGCPHVPRLAQPLHAAAVLPSWLCRVPWLGAGCPGRNTARAAGPRCSSACQALALALLAALLSRQPVLSRALLSSALLCSLALLGSGELKLPSAAWVIRRFSQRVLSTGRVAAAAAAPSRPHPPSSPAVGADGGVGVVWCLHL